MVFAGCQQKKAETCPSLEKLLRQNPTAAANAAFEMGDNRLLALEGMAAPRVPGKYDGSSKIRILPDTGDVRPRACSAFIAQTEKFAELYNDQITLRIK